MNLSNSRFRANIDPKPEGSITLGFVDMTVSEGHMHVDLYGVVVRLTQDGRPAIGFPTRAWTGRDGNVRYARTVRFDEASYAALVSAVFALPAVDAAVDIAEALRNAA